MADDHEMAIDVHGLIANSFSKEYVEAVVTDALHILPSYKDRRDSLVVINARRVAVNLQQFLHTFSELVGEHVVGVVPKAVVLQAPRLGIRPAASADALPGFPASGIPPSTSARWRRGCPG
jgi:hypothetical protein